MAEARMEAEAVMFGLFNPTPSLASMIINHYRMREDVKSFNLGGMGCSAGLIAIDLAKDMLQANPSSYAVVLSTENITLNWYFGNDRSMLLSNCIFRMGGAAALLSNKRSDTGRAKYRLLHTVRTHKGATDECFNCGGHRGAATMFEHFCVHAGCRAELEEVQRSLSLQDTDMEPSKCALHRFGNTSSSSLWYELAYAEDKGRVQRGHHVWQIGFGSGFKCNSAVWRALRDVPALSSSSTGAAAP
ncbi:unnamed protein product [Miscanthus lutarioriparius]|uniref:very-long-chain 3-oxoacyl-CoA synthase n=1 Tax=Miscanthus lutarioriparius TaxID=422564 RepID=A0A811SS45_9POAL|nr:unnamed protein product [Miscanthus lutarioriparius]